MDGPPPEHPTRVYSAPLAERHQDRIAAAGGAVVPLDAPSGDEPAALLRTVGRDPLEAFHDALGSHDDIVWAHTVGAGPDDLIDVVPADVVFTRGPGPSAGPVAEYALTALLFLARGFPQIVDAQHEHHWLKPFRARRLSELRVAIVGWGPIGRELARLCEALGITVEAVRRTPEDGASPPQHATGDLLDVLARSDAAVLVCPLTPETEGLVSTEAMDALGPSGMLVNVSRGPVVDQPALVRALHEGRLGGAVVDVVVPEPLPGDDPLWDAPRCLVTPHLGGFAGEGLGDEVIELFCENLRRFRSGTPLLHVVDRARGY